ncbi:hypothetical protein DCC85_12555 [Paenibacillus sp. CAA11]|uniref:DUF1835 domain-containing protein n=1 Tax=Paenibacillus sp. CAA11 TaxID=1532905 RepID=UPI000D3A9F78|nr:DUF1835 domain-containing protein [Paenibacillus sp. CAA11]AWB44967.1 hypothetical protein DCC85_12555 [Paenibacillus sp. CAA11]
MDNLYENLGQLREKEVRALLYDLVRTANVNAANAEGEEKRVAEGLLHLIQERMKAVVGLRLQAEALQTTVHIVFSLSDAGSLKVALSKTGKQKYCKVLSFNEMFAMGPIKNLDKSAGQQDRLDWLIEHDEDYRYGVSYNQDHQLEPMVRLIKGISESKNVVIWCANNAHDQTGLRFVLYLLRKRKQPVNIVNISELYNTITLEREEGISPIARGLLSQEHYGEIVSKYSDGFPLGAVCRQQYESEWLELANEAHLLRLWEYGKVKGCGEDQLDELIVKSVKELQEEQNDACFIDAGCVVTRVVESSQQIIGLSFIKYRIWSLVSSGALVFKGIPGALHQFL